MRELLGLLVVVAASRIARVATKRSRVPYSLDPQWMPRARWAFYVDGIHSRACVETPDGLRVVYSPNAVRCGPLVALYEAWQDGAGGAEYVLLAANEVTDDEGVAMVARADEEAHR